MVKKIYYGKIFNIQNWLKLGKTWKFIAKEEKVSYSTVEKVSKRILTIPEEFKEHYKILKHDELVKILMEDRKKLQSNAFELLEKIKNDSYTKDDLISFINCYCL